MSPTGTDIAKVQNGVRGATRKCKGSNQHGNKKLLEGENQPTNPSNRAVKWSPGSRDIQVQRRQSKGGRWSEIQKCDKLTEGDGGAGQPPTVRGNAAAVKSVCGSATAVSAAGSVCGSAAAVKSVCGSATAASAAGSVCGSAAAVKSVCGSAAAVKSVCGSATAVSAAGSGCGSATAASAAVKSVCGSAAAVKSVCGSAVKSVCGSGPTAVKSVCGSGPAAGSVCGDALPMSGAARACERSDMGGTAGGSGGGAPQQDFGATDDDLLEFAEFLARIPPLPDTVPDKVIHEFRRVSIQLLQDMELSWRTPHSEAEVSGKVLKFLLLPIAILARRRDEEGSFKEMKQRYLDRLAQVGGGDWDAFFPTDQLAQMEEPRPDETEASRGLRCARLAGKGLLSKAYAAVVGNPVAKVTPEVEQRIRALFPVGADVVVPILDEVPQIEIGADMVQRYFMSRKRGTAPGLTLFRADFIKQCLRCDEDDHQFLHLLSIFINRLANAELPQGILRLLSVTKLTPLMKDPTDPLSIRPIAVGDVFRKAAATLLLWQNQGEIGAHFGNLQVGVHHSNAIEYVCHGSHVILEDIGAAKDLLLVDATNAFNSISRQKVFDAVAKEFPAFMKYMGTFYGQPTPVVFTRQDGTIGTCWQTEGVQQGDPLGPFAFSIGLHALVQNCARLAEERGAVVKAYLDDISCVGSPETNCLVLQLLRQLGGSYGFHINLAKSKILLAAGLTEEECQQRKDMYHQISGTLEIATPNGSGGGVKYLGSPFGDNVFSERWYMHQIEAGESEFEKVFGGVDSMQIQWCLFHWCYVTKFVHWFRSQPMWLFPAVLERLDSSFRALASRILRIAIDDRAWQQMKLPINMGGFAIPDGQGLSDVGFLCGFGAVHRGVQEVAEHQNVQLATNRWYGHLATAFAEYQTACGGDEMVYQSLQHFLDSYKAGPVATKWTHQRQVALPRVAKLVDRFRTSLPNGRDTTRFRSLQNGQAGCFLLAAPRGILRMTDLEFSTSCSVRLGLRLMPAALRCHCGARLDSYGDHLLLCNRKNLWIHRHDRLVYQIKHLCTVAGFATSKLNPRGTFERLEGQPDLEPDLCIYAPGELGGCLERGNQHDLAIDLTVVCPLSTGLQGQRGDPLETRVRQKIRKYGAAAAASNLNFLPLAMDTFGRYHKSFKDFVDGVLNVAVEVKGIQWPELKRTFCQYWWTRLSVVLQKLQCKLLMEGRWRVVVNNNPPNIRRDESVYDSNYVEIVV